jgi:hypothetical protein
MSDKLPGDRWGEAKLLRWIGATLAAPRWYLGQLSVPWAVVVAASILAASIILAQFVAPYRLIQGTQTMWLFNSVTGEARYCSLMSVKSGDASAGFNCKPVATDR